MIEHEYGSLFWNDSVHKDLVIKTDNESTVITNTELHENNFELSEGISSGDSLVFGSCIASSIKFTASNIFEDLKSKWITATMSLNYDISNPFQIGRFKVYSDTPTADRKKRDIVAYDALYDIINSDVTEWYNYILQKPTDTVTLKLFRNSFFSRFGIEQEDVDLPNDNMIIAKTIEPTELSGKTVINAICEINGCFGHIGRDGKFKYVFLEKIRDGIYPSTDLYPSENLFPIQPNGTVIKTGIYIPPVTYENFKTEAITGVQIRQEENDIGALAGTTKNVYVIQDNFLVYGKDNSDLLEIAQKVLLVIEDVIYRPFNAKAKGNPCIEVGDIVRLNTKTQKIESYVLNRALKGIQSLRDVYTSEGTQYQETKANSIRDQIIQLKGKTNTLTRTVNETKSELTNLEKETNTKLLQTADKIALEAKRAKEAEASLSVRADDIEIEVSGKVGEEEVQSLIDISLEGIQIKADQIELEGYTTINGGFSIDEEGNAVLENDDSKVELNEYGICLTNKTTGDRGSYSDSAIRNYGMQWMTVVNAGVEGVSAFIMLGTPYEYIEKGYFKSINGYEPITSGNISDYVENLEQKISELDERVKALEAK